MISSLINRVTRLGPRPAPRARPGPTRLPRRAAAATAVALGLAAVPAGAEPPAPLTVVELFTSQGCSSCPPADAFLAELAARPDILALSLHVDYWDYLGWQDVYAMPAFTRRQVAYGEAAGARSVYTPQMVVQGRARLVGSHRDEAIAAIHAIADEPRAAAITLTLHEDALEVRVTPLADPAPAGVLWFVPFHSPEPLLIDRGENAGQEIAYRNVARSWMKLGKWDGRDEAVFSAPVPSDSPGHDTSGAGVAVILQESGIGPVIAAARLEY